MKPFCKLLFAAAILGCRLSGICTGQEAATRSAPFDCMGIRIGETLTRKALAARFGQPTKVEEVVPQINYYYGSSRLIFTTGNAFAGVDLNDDRFSVLTERADGGIRVGDPAASIARKFPDLKREEGPEPDLLRLILGDYTLTFRTRGGVIVAIRYGEEM